MKFWSPLFIAYGVAVLAIIICSWLIFRDVGPPDMYVVAATKEMAIQSMLNSVNVALPTYKQAHAYSDSRPGTHVFEVRVK